METGETRYFEFKDVVTDSTFYKEMNLYPRWEKWCIKRKYRKYPAIYIDIWKPYQKIHDLLPRTTYPKHKEIFDMTVD